MRKRDAVLYPACTRCWAAYIYDDDLRVLELQWEEIKAVAKHAASVGPVLRRRQAESPDTIEFNRKAGLQFRKRTPEPA